MTLLSQVERHHHLNHAHQRRERRRELLLPSALINALVMPEMKLLPPVAVHQLLIFATRTTLGAGSLLFQIDFAASVCRHIIAPQRNAPCSIDATFACRQRKY